MSFDFSIVTGKIIHRLIHENIPRCIEIVRAAYLAHARGETINPNSYFLKYPDQPSRRIIALPAHLGGDFAVSGLKWISSWPENVQRGIPRASAVLILNETSSGYPFACLEGSI